MARYIDANKLKDRIKASCAFTNIGQEGYFLQDCTIDLIDRQPTADVVEVVRCKDCIACDHFDSAKAIGEEALEGWYCEKNKRYVKTDDFCSYGERKDT